MTEPQETVHDFLARRNAEHETEFHFTLYESDVVELAAGIVPPSLISMFRACLDWSLEDLRRSAAHAAQETHRKRKARAKAGQADLELHV